MHQLDVKARRGGTVPSRRGEKKREKLGSVGEFWSEIYVSPYIYIARRPGRFMAPWRGFAWGIESFAQKPIRSFFSPPTEPTRGLWKRMSGREKKKERWGWNEKRMGGWAPARNPEKGKEEWLSLFRIFEPSSSSRFISRLNKRVQGFQ